MPGSLSQANCPDHGARQRCVSSFVIGNLESGCNTIQSGKYLFRRGLGARCINCTRFFLSDNFVTNVTLIYVMYRNEIPANQSSFAHELRFDILSDEIPCARQGSSFPLVRVQKLQTHISTCRARHDLYHFFSSWRFLCFPGESDVLKLLVLTTKSSFTVSHNPS